MPFEQPSAGLPEQKEQAPAFAGALHAFERILGPQAKPLPAEITEQSIQDELKDIVKDHRIDTYNEQTRYNELLYRRAVLQRLNELHEAKQRGRQIDPVRLKELIVAEQAVAYHEYFRDAQNQVLAVLRRYEGLRAHAQHVPQEILQMEADTQRYIAALWEATQERVTFSNVLLLDQHVAEGFGDRSVLQRLREEEIQKLSSASRAALKGDYDQKLIRGNQLNQRIIDLLAGDHGLPGMEAGYMPKRMVVEFLKYRYKQLLAQQHEIARDPALASTRVEMDRLQLKHTLAEEGKGEFTTEDKSRYDLLQNRTKSVDAQFKALGEQRRGVTDQLIALTQDLGEYNMAQTELSAIQEQFGKKYSFEGVGGISPLTTPPEIRDAIVRNMEMRKAHHLGQMNNFLEKVEQDMLDPGFKEKMEDLWNKNGREVVRTVAHRMAEFFTFAVPERFGMKEAAQDALTEPLDEALGWPAGKERWEELTDAEKQRVREKTTSILDLIQQFDRTKVQNFRTSILLLQSVKPPDTAALETVPFDAEGKAILPQERVTPATIRALIVAHGEATVSLMLLRQLQGDFGSDQPPAGFMGEYAEFLRGVNKNIDVHVDVGRACNILGQRFNDVMKWFLIAAGIGIIIGALGVIVIIKVGSKAARSIGSGLWRGTKGLARLPGRLLRSTGVAAEGSAVAELPAAAKLPVAAETKAAESALERGQSRFLGHVGFITMEVTIVSDILQSLERTANAEQMSERETLDAVRELWRDADHGMELERGGDQFWMAGYNRKYYEALVVVGATGAREWLPQEQEIIRQLQLSLDLILLLQSGNVPTDIPALPARTEKNWPEEFWKRMEAERELLQKQGADLSARHHVLVQRVKEFHTKRSAQFPVYQTKKELTEQPFTRDRVSGKINVNTSGTALGFLPVKYKNGPIMQFRKAGLDQREADEFSNENAVKEMEALEKIIGAFQKDVRSYEERGWQFERSLHYGPNAPEEKKPSLGDWMKSLQ